MFSMYDSSLSLAEGGSLRLVLTGKRRRREEYLTIFALFENFICRSPLGLCHFPVTLSAMRIIVSLSNGARKRLASQLMSASISSENCLPET